ncbi:MAG: helix-turn-helix transcriptional regulator, partial [Clostridia bacterium]
MLEEHLERREIIARLVETRLEKGISQAELARMIGTQRSNVCRLESGAQNPTLDMLLKITTALGKELSVSWKDKEEAMREIYSLRIYDTQLMRFTMEERGLEGLVTEILYIDQEHAH